MKKSQKILLFLIAGAIIGGVYLVLGNKNALTDTSMESVSQDKTDTSAITTGGVYTNEEYGFRFAYPDGWHIGNDNLGRGVLQFFNYGESKASGSVFSAGTNKIEAVVVVVSPYESPSDYPEKIHTTTKTVVAGQEVSRIETELVGGEKMLGYLIPLANTDGKFLAITIYGDPLNFRVLEDIVTDFEWVE